MSRFGTFAGGLVLGAGIMYLMDPNRGAKRRARIEKNATRAFDRARHVAENVADEARHFADGARDIVHRKDLEEGIESAVEWSRDHLQPAARIASNWRSTARILSGIAGLTAFAYGVRRAMHARHESDESFPSELRTPEYVMWGE